MPGNLGKFPANLETQSYSNCMIVVGSVFYKNSYNIFITFIDCFCLGTAGEAIIIQLTKLIKQEWSASKVLLLS